MTEKTLNIIILGPPGAGKGTQANLLEEKFDLEHIEPGDMLRELVERGDEIGIKVNRIMQEGKLVPTDLIMTMLRLRIQSLDEDTGTVFDGSPRRLVEAKALEKMLKGLGRNISHVFFLKVSKEEVIKRLAKRITCKKCDHSFIIGVDVKAGDKVCPLCGGKLFQRKDDTPEGIEKRWQTFLSETQPVVDYFFEKEMLIEINGEQPIKMVNQDILKKIYSARPSASHLLRSLRSLLLIY